MSASIRLSIRRGDQEVASATAGNQPQKIGRSKQCDVILDDPAVSRIHALLVIEGGEAILIDQDSQNGLWVQGNREPRIVLDPSVIVAMGPFRIVCEAAVTERGDETILRRPVPRPVAPPPPSPADGPVVLAPIPPVPAAAPRLPPLPARTTDEIKAAPSASSPPVSPTAAAIIPPAVTKPGEPAGKSVSAPPIKSAASTKLPPPPPLKPAPPAALTAKAAGPRNAAALIVAVIVMLILGGLGTTVWLRWRSAPKVASQPEQARADAMMPATTTAVPLPTTTAPPPASTDPVTPTLTTTTIPVVAEGTGSPAGPTSSTEPAAASDGASTGGGSGTSKPVTAVTTSAPRRADAPPGVILAAPKPRETRAALLRRSTEMTTRLRQGKAALEKGEFAPAIEILSALEREQADFGDAAAQLERARNGFRANAQQRAQAAFDEAQQKEKQQDFVGAIQGYQQAETIDADFAAKAEAAIAAARAKQKTLVDEMFKQANTDFAFRRPSAIPLYQRLLKLLAGDDPRRNEAQTKLNQLTGARPPGVTQP